MVERVGEACSDARAQVAGEDPAVYASTLVQQESHRHL
jgi:hypothetical protein